MMRPAASAITALAIATLAIAALSLAGCGQKGALYLPDAGGEIITRPTQTPAGAATPAPEPAATPATPPADADRPAQPAPSSPR